MSTDAIEQDSNNPSVTSEPKRESRKGGKGTPRRRNVPNEEIIKALEAKAGFVSLAAEALGMTYRGLEYRITKSKELQDALKQINEKKLDLSESSLMGLIKKGNLGAICFHLKCKGKHRGWVERHELTGVVDEPIVISMVPAERLKNKNRGQDGQTSISED